MRTGGGVFIFRWNLRRSDRAPPDARDTHTLSFHPRVVATDSAGDRGRCRMWGGLPPFHPQPPGSGCVQVWDFSSRPRLAQLYGFQTFRKSPVRTHCDRRGHGYYPRRSPPHSTRPPTWRSFGAPLPLPRTCAAIPPAADGGAYPPPLVSRRRVSQWWWVYGLGCPHIPKGPRHKSAGGSLTYGRVCAALVPGGAARGGPSFRHPYRVAVPGLGRSVRAPMRPWQLRHSTRRAVGSWGRT